MYAIAEVLHKDVQEVRDMPSSDYFGWLAFYEQRSREQEKEQGNLLAMDEDEMVSNLTGD